MKMINMLNMKLSVADDKIVKLKQDYAEATKSMVCHWKEVDLARSEKNINKLSDLRERLISFETEYKTLVELIQIEKLIIEQEEKE